MDSSKYAAYGLILAGAPGIDLRVLHLGRDSRAVAYSWQRRKPMPEVVGETRLMPRKRPWRSAVSRGLEHLALELLRSRARAYQVVRYDDFAGDPAATLRRALERLGLPADVGFLSDRRAVLGANHTVAGNPVRFDRGEVAIRPDREWEHGLPAGARRVVTALTWPILVRPGIGVGIRPGIGG